MARIIGYKFPFGEVRGKIGEVVIRKRRGKFYVSSVPKSTNIPPSKKQMAHRERFKKALEYARQATEEGSPTKALYEKLAQRKRREPRNVAVADFFRAPVIEEVDLSAYRGRPGDRIGIWAEEVGTLVASVRVTILTAQGEEVERGGATLDEHSTTDWSYLCSSKVEGDKVTVVVSATDLPGNETTRKVAKELNGE